MELVLLKEAIDEWIKETGNEHKVEVVTLPHASNECFALYQQWFSAKSFDVDALQMDVAWIGGFSEHLTDLSEYYEPNKIDEEDFFDAIKNVIYVEKKMVAFPLYADCGIIYYRTDLLSKYGKPVPATWQELYATAEYIQNEERKNPEKKNRFYGFVFQAKAFEVLTCNFIEAIDSFGGAIVTNGIATISSKEGIDATLFLIDCLRNISPRSVLNYSEEDARGVFQSGNAVFMRNWPYAWSLLNDPSTAVAGKVGVIPIPPSENGGKASGVLGGWYMTVSKYSRHKKYAVDLIKYLTSKAQQRRRSQHSYLPTFKSLYKDAEVVKRSPFFAYLYDSLQKAVVRPSTDFRKNYTRASSEIFNTINDVLTDGTESNMTGADVKRQLDRLNRKLNSILNKANNENKEGVWQQIKSKVRKFLGFADDEVKADKTKN
jgi:trehalose/maltose transport system substrate-binding protein